MMWRRALQWLLGLAFLIEMGWPILGFGLPGKLFEAFKIAPTDDTRFLLFVLAWCLLFVALICGYAFHLVRRGAASGWILSYILGLWWVGVGGSLFLFYGKLENLFLDGLKGALIALCAWQSRKTAKTN